MNNKNPIGLLIVLSQRLSPRLEYITDILLKRILQCGYILATIKEEAGLRARYPEAAIIHYTAEPGTLNFSIPADGLLNELEIHEHRPEWRTAPLPHLHFGKKLEGFDAAFDIFSSSFFLLTEYAHYLSPALDMHGRYDENASDIYAPGHHRQPLLHLYAEYLWKKLASRFPGLKRKKAGWDYTVSFDIDAPFLFSHKPFIASAGGFVKDIIKGRFRQLKMRTGAVLLGRKDPYDVFDEILELFPHEKLLFFFLLDRHSAYDERHTYKNTAYRKLIRSLSDKDVRTGIHPSYTSYKDRKRIAFEARRLSEITAKPVEHARMHFLRYSLPETYRYLMAAGIKHDYTSCPVNTAGFRNFIAVPFPWFDLEANSSTSLTLHPSMIMDRTLQKYMALSPDEALERTRQAIEITKQYCGHFTILLHNNLLSNWAGRLGLLPGLRISCAPHNDPDN